MEIKMKAVKSQTLNIRITPELKKQLEKLAKQNKISVSFLVEQILKELFLNEET